MTLSDHVSKVVSASGLTRLSGAVGPLIVMYHGMGGADGVSTDDFSAQLDALSNRRRIVPLREALDSVDTPAAADLASITFDDGYRDFLELADPILRDRGLHSTMFVPAGHIGGSNQWDAGRAPTRRIMTARELCELDPARVEIGAHGLSHCRMSQLDEAALQSETAGARRKLEEILQREIRFFAYPYGQGDDFDAASEQAVRRAGFAAACSTRFGRGSRGVERFRLRRVGIGERDPLEVVERKFDGAYDWTAWKEALGLRIRRVARQRSEDGASGGA
jgi:peptidoglycan/xylan/chitin deacetylase (PgdA/CDA1 family)